MTRLSFFVNEQITLEHLDIENNGIFQNEQIECELVVGKAGMVVQM